jgi:hypothetical protein
MEYRMKEKLYYSILKASSVESMISELIAMDIISELKELIQEIVLASARTYE